MSSVITVPPSPTLGSEAQPGKTWTVLNEGEEGGGNITLPLGFGEK